MFKKIDKRLLTFIIALSVGLVLGIAMTAKLNLSSKINAETPFTLTQAQPVKNVSEQGLENVFVNVSEIVGPAVVSISSEKTAKISPTVRMRNFGAPPGQNFNDEFFNKFFKDFFGEMPEMERKEMGLGSGVIIDKEGYILTNEHVINDADKITVTLSDGRKFQAQMKGADVRSDLAVIKINAKNLPYAELGDSEVIKTGQWVIAIGNPFGFMMSTPEPTVTIGVISALHRALPLSAGKERGYFDLIQTDAAINPGNSGGPLCDINGKVIGINVAIYSTTGGYQGIGFAIPINTAKFIVNDLIAGKAVKYGWLGVTVQPLDPDLAEYFGLNINDGVLVSSVISGGPAHKAGLRSGDIIVAFNNEPVQNTRDILQKVGRAKVDDKVKITIIRDKKRIILDAVVGERPAPSEEQNLISSEILPKEVSFRGIKVANITPEIKNKLGLREVEGVVISEITSDSPALEANLKVGDVIKEINGNPVKNTDDFYNTTKDLKGNVLIKTVTNFAIIKEPEKK